MKRCSRCNETKQLTDFHARAKGGQGRQARCKACSSAVSRRRYMLSKPDVPAPVVLTFGSYGPSPEPPEVGSDMDQAYWDDVDKLMAPQILKWRQEQLDQRRAWGQARRARQRDADHGCVTAEAVRMIFSLTDGLCVYCDNIATDLEHVVALATGGRHCITNLLPACGSCNSLKRTSPMEAFLAQHPELHAPRVELLAH